MEASGYTLDLYCDREADHPFDYLPHQFYGARRSEVVSMARERGWVFHRDGTHSCPRCVRGVRDG